MIDPVKSNPSQYHINGNWCRDSVLDCSKFSNESQSLIFMDKIEAKKLLVTELEKWRSKTYKDLIKKIDKPETFEIFGENQTKYQIEIQVFWDAKPNENIRVIGSIDDGGWRAFIPISDDFILSPEGKFVAE